MARYHESLTLAANKADLFLNKIFTEILVCAPEFSSDFIETYPTMVVSSHRSHMDYILIGIELNKIGFKNLRFAAGDNLTNMPYIGKNFKSWGAFPVYRSKAAQRSYIVKLARQVSSMMLKGDNIIVFPEGGRSYTGEMLEFKGGMVAAAVMAQYAEPSKRINFLPIAVSYEKIPELPNFNMLKKGKQVLRNRHIGLLRKVKGMFDYYGADLSAFAKFMISDKIHNKYGNVYLDIGEAVFIDDITDVRKNYNSEARNEFVAHRKSIDEVNAVMFDKVRRLFRILPMHLVANTAVSGCGDSYKSILRSIERDKELLKKDGRNITSIETLSAKDIFRIGLRQLRYTKAVVVKNKKLKIKNEFFANYYALTLK